MRVLHCPTDTGGNAWGLSRAERELGLDSDVMVRRSSWMQFPNDIDLRLDRGSMLTAAVKMGRFFLHAIRHYDVFHFNWGMSLLDHRAWGVHVVDLPLLKRLGKRVVVTFQGCDARMKVRSREQFKTSACAECQVAWCTPRTDEIRRRRIRRIAAHADKMFVVNPDLLHFVPGAEFLPYASVNPREWKPSGEPSSIVRPPGQPVRVLHMPTNRSIKGTRYVEEACARLREKGYSVELQLVERVPHSQARELIEQADLVVDQLLVGWYGALSVEAMALGKPVLCFLREDDLKRFVSFHDRIPIIRTTKETVEDDLADLLKRSAEWPAIGSAGRRFVEEWHDPLRIARHTIAAYRG